MKYFKNDRIILSIYFFNNIILNFIKYLQFKLNKIIYHIYFNINLIINNNNTI